MKRNANIVCVLLAITALISCVNKPSTVNDKDHAIQLLNERKYEEAIVVLKKLRGSQFVDDELTLLLSSAYAGSVGLDVIQGLGAFKPFLFENKVKPMNFSKVPDVQIDKDKLKDEEYARKVAKVIVKFLNQINSGFTVFFSLPYTDKANRSRLVEAGFTLQSVGPDSDYYITAKAYSTLINTVQFLNFTKDAFPILREDREWDSLELLCQFQPATFFGSIDQSLKYLIEGAQDLEITSKLLKTAKSPKLDSLLSTASELRLMYNQNKQIISVSDIVLSTARTSYCE